MNEPQTIFGFPVLIVDEAPKDKIIFGPPLPSAEQMAAEHCVTLEEWIRLHRKEYAIVVNVKP